MSKFGKTIHPRQFMERPAHRNQQVDIRISCQCRALGASTSHPPEDVRISAELLKRTYVRICDAEISKKAANGPTIVANGFGIAAPSDATTRSKDQPTAAEGKVGVNDS